MRVPGTIHRHTEVGAKAMDAKPIVVGVDGSPDSVRALRWAAEYAQRFDAPLQALTTWQIPTVYGDTYFGAEDYVGFEDKARAQLVETVREALGEGAQVKERVERGHPSDVLVQASKDAQLVVVGSRGLGSFRGMLLGSVSQYCVTHAHCPVIVMPHADPDRG